MVSISGMTQEALGSSSSDFVVAQVPPFMVPRVWPPVNSILAAHPVVACPLFSTPEQILHELLGGKAILWIGGHDAEVELILLASIVQYHMLRTLRLNYIGGRNLLQALHYWPQVKAFALAQHCTHIEANIRPELRRLLRKIGLRPLAHYYCEPLIAFAS